MAISVKKVYICKSCGNEFPKWQGQCMACKEWNSLIEKEVSFLKKSGSITRSKLKKMNDSVLLNEISISDQKKNSTNISELDRALSGGIIAGQVILIAGHPGIGKSTLLLQFAGEIKEDVLYVSAEESESQIARRANRLKIDKSNIHVVTTNNIENIFEIVNQKVVIIDSIQMLQTYDIEGRYI